MRPPLAAIGLMVAAGAALMAQTSVSFTQEQAARGAALYQGRCAECHGEQAQGDGNGITPPLASPEFRGNWGGLPLTSLLDRVRQESQQGSGPTFTREQQTDTLAFILSTNEIAPGSQELPSDPAVLSQVLLSALTLR